MLILCIIASLSIVNPLWSKSLWKSKHILAVKMVRGILTAYSCLLNSVLDDDPGNLDSLSLPLTAG